MTNPRILIELLESAANEPYGLCINTTNPDRLGQELHEQRTKLGLELMICKPTLPNTLFLIHRSLELPQ